VDAVGRFAAAALLALAIGGVAGAEPRDYRLDRAHAELRFELKRLGLRWSGRFDDFDAALMLDRDHPHEARLSVTIRVASLDAGIGTPVALQLFEARRYPQIRFVSTRVEPRAGSSARIEGVLTLHGVTRPLVLDAALADGDPLTFMASGSFSRRAFGIDGWAWTSDRVVLTIVAPFSLREPRNEANH